MKRCPDCKVDLQPIRLIGRYSAVHFQDGLEYTAGETPQFSTWSGTMKNRAGTVQGFVCGDRQRVLFYAEPDGGKS